MPDNSPSDALLVLLPLLIVLSTFLFLLLTFLICAIVVRRRRGIALSDNDGPVDMSREELIQADGAFDGVEARWLETVTESVRRAYARAKGLYLFFFLVFSHPTFIPTRIPAPVSSKFPSNRHNSLPVSYHSGKGCLCLVFRARLRDCKLPSRPRPHRNHFPP